MKFDVILFDLDGTLTDPGEGITNSVAHALKHYGIPVENRRDLYPFIGPPLVDSFMNFYGFSREKATEAIGYYREYYRDRGILENILYPGIAETLRSLHNGGATLAVASSKPEIFVRKILDHFALSDLFRFSGGATLGETRTEKSEVVEYVLQNLGQPDRSRTVLVGDRKFDIIGARSVGISSIGVTYGYALPDEFDETRPDFLADSPEALLKILKS